MTLFIGQLSFWLNKKKALAFSKRFLNCDLDGSKFKTYIVVFEDVDGFSDLLKSDLTD
jgi:hypothetical protein